MRSLGSSDLVKLSQRSVCTTLQGDGARVLTICLAGGIVSSPEREGAQNSQRALSPGGGGLLFRKRSRDDLMPTGRPQLYTLYQVSLSDWYDDLYDAIRMDDHCSFAA